MLCSVLYLIKIASGAVTVPQGHVMDQDAQKKLASTALVGLAVLGSVLVAWSGRTQQLLTVPGSALGSLSRNRGSLGSIGSIGAPEAACKLCCLSRILPEPYTLYMKVLPAHVCSLRFASELLCARRLYRLILQHRYIPPSGGLQVVRVSWLAPLRSESALRDGICVTETEPDAACVRRLCGERFLHSQRGLGLLHRQHLRPGHRRRGAERAEPGRVSGRYSAPAAPVASPVERLHLPASLLFHAVCLGPCWCLMSPAPLLLQAPAEGYT